MALDKEDKEFLWQLSWIYSLEVIEELRQQAEVIVAEQLAAGERQDIREIVRAIIGRLEAARELDPAAAEQEDAEKEARLAEQQAMLARVRAALSAGQAELPAGMGPEVIAPLLELLTGPEPQLRDAARRALSRLTDGGAVDELCRLWADTRQPELADIITAAGYLASRPRGVRLLTVLKTGADRVMLSEEPSLIPELLAAVDDADRVIAGRARRLLLTLTNRRAVDALCGQVLAGENERLRNWAVLAGYTPGADSRAALYFGITGQWEKYYALDWQEHRPLLAQGYAEAAPAERQRFLTAARTGGHSLLLASLLLENGQGAEYEEITDEDWAAMLDVLVSQERWPGLYRLALQAPADWAAEMVQVLAGVSWQPKAWARADWEQIAAHCPQAGQNLFVPDGRQLSVLESPGTDIACAAFHPNGRIVAGGGSDGRLRLWQVGNGSLWRTVDLHAEGITAAAFTPDGRYLATAGREGKVHIWRLPDVTWVATVKEQPGLVTALAAGSSSELLAIACAGGAAPARVWSWDGAYMTTQGQYPGSLFQAAAVAAKQRLLAGGGRDGRIRTYALAGGRGSSRLWAAHAGAVTKVALSADGRLLISQGADAVVKVWQTDNGQLLGSFVATSRLLAVSANAALAVSRSEQGLAIRQLRLAKPLAQANHADWQHLTGQLAEPVAGEACRFVHSLLTAKFRYDCML